MAAPKNPVTYLARLAKRKRRSSGSLNGARLRLWSAVEAAEACLLDAVADEDRDAILKACHAVTQTSQAYARVFEIGELEARFTALLDEVEALKKAHAGPAAALPVHSS